MAFDEVPVESGYTETMELIINGAVFEIVATVQDEVVFIELQESGGLSELRFLALLFEELNGVMFQVDFPQFISVLIHWKIDSPIDVDYFGINIRLAERYV